MTGSLDLRVNNVALVDFAAIRDYGQGCNTRLAQLIVSIHVAYIYYLHPSVPPTSLYEAALHSAE